MMSSSHEISLTHILGLGPPPLYAFCGREWNTKGSPVLLSLPLRKAVGFSALSEKKKKKSGVDSKYSSTPSPALGVITLVAGRQYQMKLAIYLALTRY